MPSKCLSCLNLKANLDWKSNINVSKSECKLFFCDANVINLDEISLNAKLNKLVLDLNLKEIL